jgi:very-short-patch-repair endonuclease
MGYLTDSAELIKDLDDAALSTDRANAVALPARGRSTPRMDDAWLDEVVPLRLADAAPQRVISRVEALRQMSADVIGYRCRSGRWLRLAPAVYLTTPPASLLDHLRAAVLHGGADCVLSGSAALAAWGFRTTRAPLSELVLAPTTSGVETWGRIRVRRTVRLPRPRHRWGLPLAPVARAVADHALELRRLDRVQALVAEAVQGKRCTVTDLAAELAAGPRRDSRLLREALRDVGYGAHSVPEATAARLLRRAALTGFEQNADIHVDGKRFVADFLWRGLRAVLEIDSTEYHLTPEDHTATLARDQLLQAAGYAVLHVKPSQLRDPARFVAIVWSWLTALARRSAG